MIHFCVTNDNSLIFKHHKNQITCKDFYISFDDKVQLLEDDESLTLFCGILWEGTVDEVIRQAIVPNGQFYCISINKSTGIISGATDVIEDFPVYYMIKDDKVVFTSNLINIKSTFNKRWIYRCRWGVTWESFYPPIEGFSNPNSKETILENVYRVGSLCYFIYDKVFHYKYYVKPTYYIDSFVSKYTFNETLDISKEILQSNIKKVTDQYDNLITMGGTGIDSMVIVGYQENIPLISYKGDWWTREVIPKFLDNQTIFSYTKDEYEKTSITAGKYWETPWMRYDYTTETCIYREKIDPTSVILNGTYGDHIYWHEPFIAIAMCIYFYNLPYEKVHSFLEDKYCYNPEYISETDYNRIKGEGSFEKAVTSRMYFSSSYLKGLRITGNRLILSPYIDLRLKTLLPQSDRDTQERSCFEAEIQKKLVPTHILKFVNKYKIGTEEGSRLFFSKEETDLSQSELIDGALHGRFKNPYRKHLKYFIENYEKKYLS